MALSRCLECSTLFAAGLFRCPLCKSTEHEEEGNEAAMPKITLNNGPSNARAELDPDYEAPEQGTEVDDEEVDPEADEVVSYDDMSAKVLKAELRRRRDAGRDIDTSGVRTRSQLIEVLRADDESGVEGSERED